MTRCNYWDCGWCMAPKEVETNAKSSSACESPQNCPYLKSIMENYPNRPQPPEPRLIREDFLPDKMDSVLNKFRIEKAPVFNLHTEEMFFSYIIEEKRWFGWKKLGFNGDIISMFFSYTAANKALYRHIMNNTYRNFIEYLPPDFSNINKEPNIPPKNPYNYGKNEP